MKWGKKINRWVGRNIFKISPLLGGKLTYRGDFYFSDHGSVEATIYGNVASESFIELKEGSRIEGNVRAQGLNTEGSIHGAVSASESVSLSKNANIQGDLKAGSLELHKGADFEGRLEVGIEQKQQQT
ncbi:MAG: polymer-forming cytoskeletal protein [Verrucomicrobiota bacterium]